jgi:hypothetical protein
MDVPRQATFYVFMLREAYSQIPPAFVPKTYLAYNPRHVLCDVFAELSFRLFVDSMWIGQKLDVIPIFQCGLEGRRSG